MHAGSRPRALVAWSSGKDSAYALHEVRRAGDLEVVGLLTTVTHTFGRVAMHGVREALLEAQAASISLPLARVEIPYPCPNEVYEQAMADVLASAAARGVTHVVFGDLFLTDIRAYREAQLAPAGFTGVFPLWGTRHGVSRPRDDRGGTGCPARLRRPFSPGPVLRRSEVRC